MENNIINKISNIPDFAKIDVKLEGWPACAAIIGVVGIDALVFVIKLKYKQ